MKRTEILGAAALVAPLTTVGLEISSSLIGMHPDQFSLRINPHILLLKRRNIGITSRKACHGMGWITSLLRSSADFKWIYV